MSREIAAELERDPVYVVRTPAFDGPIELLLTLAQRAEVDLKAVSLASLTDEYLRAIEQEAPPLDRLAAFLVIGARLVQIKAAGLMPEDSAQLDGLVHDYMQSGNGAISVSVPDGPDSSRAISYFGERLVDMGVPRSRILVGARPLADGDRRVEISFVSYVAHTEPCGDWSADASETASNLPMPNFGCAVQHNVAAMVANPRDLDQPRGLGAADATRRAAVMGHYEKGEVTQADKHTVDKGTEQSAPGSNLSN